MPRRDRFEDDDDRYDDRPRRRGYRGREDNDEDDDRRGRYRDDQDEDDYDRGERDSDEPTNGPATTSLILGILSLVGGVTSIPGLICGVVGLNKAKQLDGAGKGTAVTGTILSGVGVVVLGVTIWLAISYFGGQSESRTRRMASNNLKMIGLAMHSVHDTTMQISTGIARSPNDFGRPLRESELPNRLSWRVDLLPYLEQGNLFSAFNTSEAWDSATNRRHADTVVSPYADPDAKTDPATRWRTFYGRGAPFNPELGNNRQTLMSITDGTSNTIYVAESGEKVTWSRFGEIKFDERNPPSAATFGRVKSDTFQVLLFDGSVRNLRKTISPMTFGHAITHAGGEVLDLDWDDGDAPRRGRW